MLEIGDSNWLTLPYHTYIYLPFRHSFPKSRTAPSTPSPLPLHPPETQISDFSPPAAKNSHSPPHQNSHPRSHSQPQKFLLILRNIHLLEVTLCPVMSIREFWSEAAQFDIQVPGKTTRARADVETIEHPERYSRECNESRRYEHRCGGVV